MRNRKVENLDLLSSSKIQKVFVITRGTLNFDHSHSWGFRQNCRSWSVLSTRSNGKGWAFHLRIFMQTELQSWVADELSSLYDYPYQIATVQDVGNAKAELVDLRFYSPRTYTKHCGFCPNGIAVYNVKRHAFMNEIVWNRFHNGLYPKHLWIRWMKKCTGSWAWLIGNQWSKTSSCLALLFTIRMRRIQF